MKKIVGLLAVLTLLAACSQVSPPNEDPLFGSDAGGEYEVIARSNLRPLAPQKLAPQATNEGDQAVFYTELRRYSGSNYRAVFTAKGGNQDQMYVFPDELLLFSTLDRTYKEIDRRDPPDKSYNPASGKTHRDYGNKRYIKTSNKTGKICAQTKGYVRTTDDGSSETEEDWYDFTQKVCFVVK